jgi:hypothetical protein
MKIKINTDIIKSLNPCKNRLDNWLLHYKAFEGDLVEFLDLPDISYADKVWVAVRVMPRFLVEVFAIDCAFNAAAADYAASAAYAASAYPAAYSASAAATTSAYASDAASVAATYASAADSDAACAASAAYSAADAYAASAHASVAAFADWGKQRQIESLIYLIQGAK